MPTLLVLIIFLTFNTQVFAQPKSDNALWKQLFSSSQQGVGLYLSDGSSAIAPVLAIGSSSIDPSAKVEIYSTEKGIITKKIIKQ